MGSAMKKPMINNDEILAFQERFDISKEIEAIRARETFIANYPLNKLKYLTLDEYIIGKGSNSFCGEVEAKTLGWARIQGSTAIKFGIYYSKKNRKYIYGKKFGRSQKDALNEVKSCLLKLLKDGKELNFEEIDKNQLSQMFKAKILSLYYPDTFLNVCSKDLIEELAGSLNIDDATKGHSLYISELQHRLISSKAENELTKHWSNPRFMNFLLYKFYKNKDSVEPAVDLTPPKKAKKRKRYSFENSHELKIERGKKSEAFAIAWEKKRLELDGYTKLVDKVKDMTPWPSYGYDLLSHTKPGIKRYIEVKSVGFDHVEKCNRFYLSENEWVISQTAEFIENYYFYLVIYGKDGEPIDLIARRANEIYANTVKSPCSYIVRFDLNKIKEQNRKN